MKIVESVCGNCGAKDTLFPVSGDSDLTLWKCKNCGKTFKEERETENEE